MTSDLNRLYTSSPALYRYEFNWQGFEWIDCHDSQQSVLSYIRRGEGNELMLVVVNLTPVTRHGYRIGAPWPGAYREVFNSDSEFYGGSNVGNGSNCLYTEEWPWMNRSCSLSLVLPPLAAIVLTFEG
jgi:1,4-alpha-glucan branching enzyme